ncbi:MAG: hypothetical protein KBT11_10600 [Treponema sp.]|nr:hypothetical protein [Candidatus Treponema equifaecale]
MKLEKYEMKITSRLKEFFDGDDLPNLFLNDLKFKLGIKNFGENELQNQVSMLLETSWKNAHNFKDRERIVEVISAIVLEKDREIE